MGERKNLTISEIRRLEEAIEGMLRIVEFKTDEDSLKIDGILIRLAHDLLGWEILEGE